MFVLFLSPCFIFSYSPIVYSMCVCVCMYVYVYVCMYVCVYVCLYVCIYLLMYVCTYECMYVCTYECMCVNVHLIFMNAEHCASYTRLIISFFKYPARTHPILPILLISSRPIPSHTTVSHLLLGGGVLGRISGQQIPSGVYPTRSGVAARLDTKSNYHCYEDRAV